MKKYPDELGGMPKEPGRINGTILVKDSIQDFWEEFLKQSMIAALNKILEKC